jgi:hypothetical protein
MLRGNWESYKPFRAYEWIFQFRWGRGARNRKGFETMLADTEPDARAKMLIYLLEKNLLSLQP